MNYFGTQLTSAGHFFWKLDGDFIDRKGAATFSELPFDPENLPHEKLTKRLGEVHFYHIGGYSILRIEGSCYDKRPASKSVFFLKEIITKDEMRDKILSIPIAKKIIAQMPFQVNLN